MSVCRSFGLLGDPVAHSLSPRVYGAAFSHLGISAIYECRREPRQATASDLRRSMLGLAESGGGNVTVPHKQLAASVLDVSSPAVDRTGACNCFWMDADGRLAGDNTDIGGFLEALTDLDGLRLEGASVLLLGAGGAARAVAAACSAEGVRRLAVCNRSARRAETLVSEVGIDEVATVVLDPMSLPGVWDLVVNATSLGMSRDDALPLVLEPHRFHRAFDVVYAPGGTRWSRHAAALGIPAIDGLPMLVHQAVLSIENWFGAVVDREGLIGTMRRAVSEAESG